MKLIFVKRASDDWKYRKWDSYSRSSTRYSKLSRDGIKLILGSLARRWKSYKWYPTRYVDWR